MNKFDYGKNLTYLVHCIWGLFEEKKLQTFFYFAELISTIHTQCFA